MAGFNAMNSFKWLSRSSRGLLSGAEATTQRCLSRSISTEAPASPDHSAREALLAKWAPKPVLATTYSFPSMEPVRFVQYPQNKLLVPLRKDLLHRAVVYEGDMTRQGTASTKWRDDVRGSGRKLRPQKGSGRARVGDKMSPIRRGGGVAFGPHPRDFSTDLPAKMYDQAWRIALSYRFKRGQLIIIDNEIDIPLDATPHLIKEIFKVNRWGHDYGRSTLITTRESPRLFDAVGEVGEHAKILSKDDVDVKDLLETGRLIMEKRALDRLLSEHSRDINSRPAKAI
ncbi:ribosomal protein L4 domain-containing protein [Aspergillus pseudoustus]|uniref:Large ribosomal subunit protein uL4m n=1 Tax=Aspergillus pseudoustus TaxID=1810923 RepID=A0ABR4KGS4_9EURO